MNFRRYHVKKIRDEFITVFGNIKNKKILISVDINLVQSMNEDPFISFPVKAIFDDKSRKMTYSEEVLTYNIFIKKTKIVDINILNVDILNIIKYESVVNGVIGRGLLITVPKDKDLSYQLIREENTRSYVIKPDGEFKII